MKNDCEIRNDHEDSNVSVIMKNKCEMKNDHEDSNVSVIMKTKCEICPGELFFAGERPF